MRFRREALSPELSGVVVFCVETEETEEASSSPPTPRNMEWVELLFFRGRGASIFPGSSVLNRLWSFAKSPYRFPT